MNPVPSPLNPPQILPVDLDDLVVSTLAEHQVPGCSVAVSYGERHWHGAYGLARVDPELPFLPDTRIPVASMTKPFTAAAVMALVEAGAVDLDTPIRHYLPDFRVADQEATESATVRHLLIHRTGWQGDEPELVDDRGAGALADQVAALGSLVQFLPPGTTFSYCNTGLDVAGRLVEVMGGGGYESIIERTILRPLGMTHSTFFAEQVVSAPAASGHVRAADGTMRPVQDPWLLPRGVNPSGGLISSARDQLLWMRWWLGTLDAPGPLTPETRERMAGDLVPIGSGPAATGLGWHVDHVHGDAGNVRSVYHEGSLRGTATVCRFVPEVGLAVVVLTNADDGQLVHRAVSDRLLAELAGIRRPDRKLDEHVDERTLAGYAGAYRAPDAASCAEVTAGPGTLRLHVTAGLLDHPLDMSAGRVEDDDFALVDGPMRSEPLVFLRTPEGELFGLRLAGRVFVRAEGEA
ncbi:serine hydrolase domain-containing protein [Nonomuraea turcica]|uniref:serine hydrolase domain-containing protein n=1 Tax=Nonomuraea sp. G32 TaxID=3067274 RepID=UPI00273C967C|nr:serine hydrolase domain-containing protein [Nonomuraea sp. G32]MDP4501322.1 serine hydrolase domain-containing protein [Nonomuraea sp. G32]